MISLNLTVRAARSIPTPSENKIIIASGITLRTTVQCNSARIATITRINATSDAIKLMKLENTLAITNKYFGTYTFLISAALPMIEVMELVVASLKKLKIN